MCVDEQGSPLVSINQLKELTRNGQSVLVKLLEPGEQLNSNKNLGNFQEINEEDEDYKEDKFEEEQSPTAVKASFDRVKTAFNEFRLILMIKKIPHTHMVRYLLAGITLPKDNKGDDILTT